MFKKIFDINKQVEQLTNDVINSNDTIHYVIAKQNGLLYITDIKDAENCINSNKYKAVGTITRSNNHIYVKDKLVGLIKEYNLKLN